MKVLTFTILILLMNLSFSHGQELSPKAYALYPTLGEMYGFAVGKYRDQVLIFGGMIKSDVPELSNADFPNHEIILIDLGRNRVSAYGSGNLDGVLSDQMSATGLAYYQKDNMLYIVGGYGYSDEQERFITFPYMTVIDLEATVSAITAGKNPVAFFYQINDERLAVFNAVMDYNGQEFFLINGTYAHKLRPFDNEPYYEEMDRTGEAHTFRMEGAGEDLNLQNFRSWYDVNDLRDYYGSLLPPRIEQEVEKALQKKIH